MRQEYVERAGLLIHRDHAGALEAAGLASLDALLSVSGAADLRKPGLAPWRQRIVLETGAGRYYLKRYTRPPLRVRLAQAARGFGCTAGVEWHWLHEVRRLGIGTPLPVAMGSRGRGLREQASALLLAELPGTSLEKWVPAQLQGALADAATRDELSRALASLVRTLHGAGLFHRDLYLAHVFVRAAPAGGHELALIDLHRMVRRRWLRLLHDRLRVKDLAALNYSTPPAAASPRDRLRWLKRYLGCQRLSWPQRMLIRMTEAKTRRIARHSRKHGL